CANEYSRDDNEGARIIFLSNYGPCGPYWKNGIICYAPKERKMMTDRRAFGFNLAAAAAGAGATPAHAADDVREANKRTVLAFYDAALNRSNFDEAAAYFGPHYIQHNPMIKDGIEGFRSFLQDLKKQFPGLRSDVKRIFADGD